MNAPPLPASDTTGTRHYIALAGASRRRRVVRQGTAIRSSAGHARLSGSRLPSTETRDRPGERLDEGGLAVGGSRVAAQLAVGLLGVGELLGEGEGWGEG